MGDATPIVWRGEKLLADHLLASKSIPEAEFSLETTIRLLGNAARDKRLSIDDFPVLKTRSRIGIGNFFNESTLVDRCEQARPLKIGRDDRGDIRSELISRKEIGDGDRQWLDHTLVDVDFHNSARRHGADEACGNHTRESRKDRPDLCIDDADFHLFWDLFVLAVVGDRKPGQNISLGSKLTITSDHESYLSTGRLYGAQRATARLALSAAARATPSPPPPDVTCGAP